MQQARSKESSAENTASGRTSPVHTTSDRSIYGLGALATIEEYLHACPICGADDLRHYCRVPALHNEGQYIRYDQCHGCGTAIRNPRMPRHQREASYEQRQVSPETVRHDPSTQYHYRVVLSRIARATGALHGKTLLDFGCGAGGFLLEARDAGLVPVGIELSKPTARYVTRQFSIPVEQAPADAVRTAGGLFDIVVSTQVFEHLVDPVKTLRELRDSLKPGGLLYIEVPNLNDTRERLRRGCHMDDSHLFYFTARSMAGMLRANGFDILRVEQGLRTYRRLGSLGRRLPDVCHEALQRMLSALGIRTQLAVLASHSGEDI
jgi:2-polyprenyl-3-methyl-5-hydroxy-6-metoxy-1,4-benzoquinol methylase